MREIKFRVWNGEVMINPDYIQNGRAYWYENSIPEMSDEIMQYIGLRDKNGKEVYERDIIEANIIKYHLETRGCIVFDEDLLLYASENEAGNTPLFELDQIRIIDNIYENPELLDKD